MVVEFFPNDAIGLHLRIPALKCLVVNACFVDLDHGIIDQFHAREAHVILGMQEEEELDLFDCLNRHFHGFIPIHRIMQTEDG